MFPVLLLALGAVAQGITSEDTQTLISFPDDKWSESDDRDDPAMAGQSKGTLSLVNNSHGLWQGAVKNVSSLHGPGFCGIRTSGTFKKDISAYIQLGPRATSGALILTVRTATPEYSGFKLAFGPAPQHHGGHSREGSYKANFNVPASEHGEWQKVSVPFSLFSYDWSDFTGDCFSSDPTDHYQHKCCYPPSQQGVCPQSPYVNEVDYFNIVAEGHEGEFQLELSSIEVTGPPKHVIV